MICVATFSNLFQTLKASNELEEFGSQWSILRCGFPVLLSVCFGVYSFAQWMALGFLTASHPVAEGEKGISRPNLCRTGVFYSSNQRMKCQEVSSWFQGLPISDKAGI